MDKGSIGEYAKSKISEIIDWLNLAREEQLKNEKLQVNKFDKLSSKKENHKRVIEIIDEPIIKSKLIEMYSEIFGNDARREYLACLIHKPTKTLKIRGWQEV